jgi:Icc-related predicted phosphoesterase
MKILAFTDIHGSSKHLGYISGHETLKLLDRFKKEIKEKKIGLVVCTGDFTLFGDHIELLLKKISQLGTEVLLIHGNHEDEIEVKVLSKRYPNIEFLHKKMKRIGDYVFIGYGGGGFAKRDPEFVHTMKKLTEKLSKNDKIVLLTHGPPFGTKIDQRPGYGHVGNQDYREFIEKHNVVLALSGHIHEGFGKQQKIGKALVMDAGPEGKILTLE